MLASAATIDGENLDLKAQRAFIAGINCKITCPRLRYAREEADCTMKRLLEVAELAEVHYGLKRVDPTDTKSTPTRADGLRQPIRMTGRFRRRW